MTSYNEADQEAIEFVARKIRAQARETTGAMAEMSERITALEVALEVAMRRIAALEQAAKCAAKEGES